MGAIAAEDRAFAVLRNGVLIIARGAGGKHRSRSGGVLLCRRAFNLLRWVQHLAM